MTKFAVLIAIEDYLDPTITNVAHAKHDAEEFSKTLAMHGFDKTNQLCLINSQATKGVTITALKRVEGIAFNGKATIKPLVTDQWGTERR